MSGLPKGKKSKAQQILPSITKNIVRPEDVAVKPKPSLTALPKRTKPLLTSLVPTKKAKLDFSSASTSAIPAGKSSLPIGGSCQRPPLDLSYQDFCKTAAVDVNKFAEYIEAAIAENRFNKACKQFTAVLKTIIDKKDTPGDIPPDYVNKLLPIIVKTAQDHAVKLTNMHFHKCLLTALCSLRAFPGEIQTALITILTSIMDGVASLDPYYMIAYLHDSLQDRHFVDRPDCNRIVSLIVAPFATKYPARDLYSCSSDLNMNTMIPDASAPNKFLTGTEKNEHIFDSLLDVLRKWWLVESPPRNLLRTMCAMCGLTEVRLVAAKKIDSWLQNVKIQRYAFELLLFLGMNFGPAIISAIDSEVLGHFLRLKSLKGKQVLPVYNVALREMVLCDASNLRAATRLIIVNEFGPGPQRYPLNMSLFHQFYALNSNQMTRVLAEELSRMVNTREEFAKPARLFTREFVRSLKTDFNFPVFAEAYLNLILEEAFGGEHGIEDHVYRSATEVITMLPIVAVSPSIREAAALRRNGTSLPPDVSTMLSKFEEDLRNYFEVCLKWLLSAKQLFSEYGDYLTAYFRYLFLEKMEYYVLMDQGPTEAEYVNCIKLFGEAGMTDQMVWLIAGEKFFTLNSSDVITVLEELTKRCLNHKLSTGILKFKSEFKPDILVERVLSVCVYRPAIPFKDEIAPVYQISTYWRAWMMVVKWICVGKPSDSLVSVFDAFPTFRLFVYMILTKQFVFPVPFEGNSEERMVSNELEFIRQEKEKVSANAKIVEAYMKLGVDMMVEESSMFPCYCVAKPRAVIRRIPESVISELEIFAREFQIAASLCSSREPDLLKELIRSDGASKAMPAIQELLNSNDSAINELPLVVMCQFLIYNITNSGKKKFPEEKETLIKNRLKASLRESRGAECLHFLLGELSNGVQAERSAALQVIGMICGNKEPFTIKQLSSIPAFEEIKESACVQLCKAIFYESDPPKIEELVSFVVMLMNKENMHQCGVHLSLIADRLNSAAAAKLIPAFGTYIVKCGDYSNHWPENDLVGTKRYVLTVGSRKFNVASVAISAILKLLCKTEPSQQEHRKQLINLFFPISRDQSPNIEDENGTAIEVFPEEIKGSMLCASDDRIVKVALDGVSDLTALQLICSFGLTNFAATELLRVADEIPVENLDRDKLLAAHPFIRAYQIRGAQGGNNIMKHIEKLRAADKAVKEEAMDTDVIPCALAPPPATQSIKLISQKMTRAEVVQALKDATNTSAPQQFSCSHQLLRSALASEDVALACVEHFERNLKFFLDNVEPFRRIMTVLSAAADRFPPVHSRVTSLSTRVLKSASIPAGIEGYLKKFASPVVKKTEKKTVAIEKISADEILAWLTRQSSVSQADRARFLNAFLDKRPEVIDRNLDGVALDRQILTLLTGKNGVESLVAQFVSRAAPLTQETVIHRILDEFDKRFKPNLVCDLVQSFCVEEYTKSFTEPQLTVLASYFASLVMIDESTAAAMQVLAIIDKLVETAGFKVLIPIGTALIQMVRSEMPKAQRDRVKALLNMTTEEFPCMKVSRFTSEVSLVGPQWRKEEADRYATSLLEALYINDGNESSAALDSVHQLISSHPSVMAREFGIMANQLSLFLNMVSREARATSRMSILKLTRFASTKLMPLLKAKDLHHVDNMIQLLIAIFEKHFVATPQENYMSDAILSLCFAYMEHDLERARQLLSDQRSSLETLCAYHPNSPVVLAIQDHLKNFDSSN